MNQYLKHYQVVMRTLGPVFIGNGKEIGKKEYVFLNQSQVGIPDIQALYQEIAKRKKAECFEEYMLGNSRDDLTSWLRKQKISMKEIQPFIKYTLDCGDSVIEKGSRLQVMGCVKDAYGKPYVPGSSLKGMFRTIFLGSDIIGQPQKYQGAKDTLQRNADIKRGRTEYLKTDIARIEKIAYRTLRRNEERLSDAVNDVLQGLVISDSEPLSLDSLVLCQRVELHTNGMEKRLPILRECIKPGTEIRYTITIDTSICNWTEELLMKAVQNFMESYRKNFMDAFKGAEMPKADDIVLLGGGCGFVSKTVVYPLYGKKEGIAMTQKIFDKTKVPRIHKHDLDGRFGASPHILKCTKYRGRTFQMGMCRIEQMKEKV